MDAERRDDDRGAEDDAHRVEEEVEAAASEAGAIGGPGADEDLDPAERPLAEAGEGEAEGFELAERELAEHASHGHPAPDPSDDELISEEGPGDHAEHGAADHVHSTERRDEEQTH